MNPPSNPTVESGSQTVNALAEAAPTFLQPRWAIVLLAAALVASLTIAYLARLPGLRSIRHWLLLTRAVVWAGAVFGAVFTLSLLITGQYWLPLGVVLIALVAVMASDWLRNVAAGFTLEFEGEFRPGDMIRHRQLEGQLVAVSTRTVTLRANDGTLHQIPNARFISESITHLEADGESVCTIAVALPSGVTPQRAVKLAEQAALLTPFASPRHRPDVFLDVADDDASSIQLHVRGYAFDPAYRSHFRSEVVARVHELLRTEQAVSA